MSKSCKISSQKDHACKNGEFSKGIHIGILVSYWIFMLKLTEVKQQTMFSNFFPNKCLLDVQQEGNLCLYDYILISFKRKWLLVIRNL